MKVYQYISISEFEFWGGAKRFAEKLTSDELDSLDLFIEDCYPNGIDATQLNDIFWFECDSICELLGLSEDEVWDR